MQLHFYLWQAFGKKSPFHFFESHWETHLQKTHLSCSDCQTWNCKTINALKLKSGMLFVVYRGYFIVEGFLLFDVWQDSNTLPPAFFEGTPVFGGSVKDVNYLFPLMKSLIRASLTMGWKGAESSLSTTHTFCHQIHCCARKAGSIL